MPTCLCPIFALYVRHGMWHGASMSDAESKRGAGWVRRLSTQALALIVVSACSQPASKPADSPTSASQPSRPGGAAPASRPSEPSRLGTVALVRPVKQRGLTSENWTGVVGSLFTFDTEKDVTRVVYEVTIFFADGTQADMVVDHDPGVEAGQRVRVTGKRIEPLDR